MRVVDVSSAYSSAAGGIKRYYREKASRLSARGVEAHFVVPGESSREEAFGGGTLHVLRGPALPGNGSYHTFGAGLELASLLRALRPDVVEVATHFALPSMIERAFSRGRRPRVVGFFHSHPRMVAETFAAAVGSSALGSAVGAGVWSWFRRQHRRYDATIVASHAVENLLVTRGFRAVRWVGLGVDLEVFRPAASVEPDGPPTLLYAGRFTPDKELGVLLDAYDLLVRSRPVRLRLLGGGPWVERLSRWARERPLVRVDGYLDEPSRVAEALGRADVAVVPSRAETFSFAAAEALACGVPVVGARASAVAELLCAADNGATFEAGDATSLAGALRGLLAEPPSARRTRGLAGREALRERLDWSAVIERLCQVYGEVLSR